MDKERGLWDDSFVALNLDRGERMNRRASLDLIV